MGQVTKWFLNGCPLRYLEVKLKERCPELRASRLDHLVRGERQVRRDVPAALWTRGICYPVIRHGADMNGSGNAGRHDMAVT